MTPREFNKSNFIKSAVDNIDVGQIGQGDHYTEGAWSGKHGNRGWGLKGQLNKYKKRGFRSGETKNLSKKNLEDMESMISGRLQKHRRGSTAIINRGDKKAIMKEAEQLVRTKGSKFSRQDKNDLKKVVSTLQQKSREAILGSNDQGVETVSNNEIAVDAINNSQTTNLNNTLSKNNLGMARKVWRAYKKFIGLPNYTIKQTAVENEDYKKLNIDLPNPEDAKDMPIDTITEPLILTADKHKSDGDDLDNQKSNIAA